MDKKVETNYIISSFKEAAKNSVFQHRWMMAKTWVALINHFYKPPISLIFNGKQLLDAISRTKRLITLIETTGVIDDTLCRYKSRHRPKGGKQLYCFYATPKGEKPTVKENPWHYYIDDANSLLNKVLTRSEKKKQLFSSLKHQASSSSTKTY